MTSIRTVSPVDGRVVVERPFATSDAIARTFVSARSAFAAWRDRGLEERKALVARFIEGVLEQRAACAEELTLQMGRPVAQTPSELKGFEHRARVMLDLAQEALSPVRPTEVAGFERYIERIPLGVGLCIVPWNYPWLTAVNSLVPALVAGNCVILKHSPQTPLVAERLDAAARAAGLPAGVFQIVHASVEQTQTMVAEADLDFVVFTGSVEGGRAIQRAAGQRILHVALELGGKDPAYVRADAELERAAENLVDGSFFNSGQSCCAVERIYVHESVFNQFVERFVELTRGYVLGNPMDPATTLGPVVSPAAASRIRAQVAAAIAGGARPWIDPAAFAGAQLGAAYLPPQVLTQVDHSMAVMTEETFGPVAAIMSVRDDDEAVSLMNDSVYGLTGSVWTTDLDAARALGRRVETGTWFMNRCDYLDPALAWCGVKLSGRSCSLSRLGYEALTRPKSFHLRF